MKNDKDQFSQTAGVMDLANLLEGRLGGESDEGLIDPKDLETGDGDDDDKGIDPKDLETDEEPEEEPEEEQEEAGDSNEDPDGERGGEEDTEQSVALKAVLADAFPEYMTIIQTIDGKDVEVPIADIVMDTEMFSSILKQALEDAKNSATQGKVDVEGLSDFTRTLMEVEKKGGNISEVIKLKEHLTDPLSLLDLSTKQGQVGAITMRLRMGGMPEDNITRLLASYEKDGLLEDYSYQAEEEIKAYVKQSNDKVLEEARLEEERKKENAKTFRKDMKMAFNELGFEIKESLQSKIVDTATKVTEDGKLQIDKHYESWMSDPKKAARLAVFLMANEEYDAQVSKKKVEGKQISTLGKLRLVKKDTNSRAAGTSPRTKEDDGLVSIEDLEKR